MLNVQPFSFFIFLFFCILQNGPTSETEWKKIQYVSWDSIKYSNAKWPVYNVKKSVTTVNKHNCCVYWLLSHSFLHCDLYTTGMSNLEIDQFILCMIIQGFCCWSLQGYKQYLSETSTHVLEIAVLLYMCSFHVIGLNYTHPCIL
jgi:hypothetical protein